MQGRARRLAARDSVPSIRDRGQPNHDGMSASSITFLGHILYCSHLMKLSQVSRYLVIMQQLFNMNKLATG